MLSNVSMRVAKGEFVSLIGSSGSGKSTLFKLLAGLLEPTHGTINIPWVQEGKRLGQVAYMPQKDLLLPWRTVMENCMLPLNLLQVGRIRYEFERTFWPVSTDLAYLATRMLTRTSCQVACASVSRCFVRC